jgi:hypothetical protein
VEVEKMPWQLPSTCGTEKHQAPTSQAPEKYQTPSSKSGLGGVLKFGAWDFSGAWMLVFGI